MTLTKGATASAVFLFLVLAAPLAYAQDLPDPAGVAGQATDAVDDAAGQVGDAAAGATNVVDDAVDGTSDAAAEVTGTVGNAAGQVTDAIEDAGGPNGEVPDVPNAVGNTVEELTTGNGGGPDPGDVTDPVTDAVGGLTGGHQDSNQTTSGIVNGLLGSGNGSTSVDDITSEVLDELIPQAASQGLSPAAAEGWLAGDNAFRSNDYATVPHALASLTSVMGDLAQQLGGASAGDSSRSFGLGSSSGWNSFLDTVGRVAAEAAKALAFPLALALLVVGFLAVQGRIGRKDPKLVLAPIDAAEESLTFE